MKLIFNIVFCLWDCLFNFIVVLKMEKSNSDDIELENDDLDDEKDPFVSSHRQRLISAQILDSQCEDASVGEDSNVILQTMSPKASKSSTSVSSAAIDSVIELQQSTLADMDLTIANLKSWHERRLASSSETGGWGTASDNDESPYAYPETDDADEKGSSFFSTELRESSDDKRSGWTNGKDADIEAILGGALERRVQEDEERRKLREMGRASAGAIESLLRSPRGLGGSDMKDTSFDEVGSRAYMSSDLADRLKRVSCS